MSTYTGIVEDNNDPKKLGRVRIRIPALHGVEGSSKYIPTSGLPWVEPPGLSGYQYGSLIVPPNGTTVTVTEEDSGGSGTPYRRYSGGSFGEGASSAVSKKLNDKPVPKGKLETPKEATDDYPNTKVIYKDTSGAVVYVDGTGGIILRTGKATVRLGGNTIRINASDTTVRVNTDSILMTDKNVKIEINGDKVIATNGVYTMLMDPDELSGSVGTGEEGSEDTITVKIKEDKITLENTDQQLLVELGEDKITLEQQAEELSVILGEDKIEMKNKSTVADIEDQKIMLDTTQSKMTMDGPNVKIEATRIDLEGDTYVKGVPVP